jgi:rhomboid family GlyGly-CTERM serine protease
MERRRLLIIASVLVALLPFAFPSIDGWLQYDRPSIGAGEVWRLVTGHWTHWSADHLFWSGGAFLLLVGLCRGSARRVLACVMLSAVAVGAAVWAGTDLQFYRGLSGIDSALFMMVAVDLMREKAREGELARLGVALALVAGFVAKLAYEWLTGGAVFVDALASGMTPVPLAHAVGAAVGVVMALWPGRGCRGRPSTPMMGPWRFRCGPVAGGTGSISAS